MRKYTKINKNYYFHTPTLARGPAQLPAAQDMNMKVVHRLATFHAIVDHYPEQRA